MANEREMLLERVKRAITVIQEVHNDSRTPLDVAMALVDPLRQLTDLRRKLREAEFQIAANNPEYIAAAKALGVVTDKLAEEIAAHQEHMKFLADVAAAVDQVIKLAIAVAAVVV